MPALSTRPDLAEKREELRRRIRDAAIAEFAENGLKGASTQAIADRAGISKTKLHYYIESKEALYREALDHILEVWADLFHGIPADEGPETFLRDYIARKVRFSLERPDVVRMFSSEVMRGAPFLRDYWAKSHQDMDRASALIRDWVAQGRIRPVDPRVLQFHVWALTEYYALHGTEVRFMLDLREDATLDAQAITDEVAELVLLGLRP